MNFYMRTDEMIAHLAEHDVTPDDFEFGLAILTRKARAIPPGGRACGDARNMDGT